MRMVFLDPGMLRTRLNLAAPQETPDGQGGTTLGFALLDEVWGRVEPVAARSDEEAGAPERTVTHRVTIRHRADVAGGMRFGWAGRSLTIETAHDPDGSGRYLFCFCREVTP